MIPQERLNNIQHRRKLRKYNSLHQSPLITRILQNLQHTPNFRRRPASRNRFHHLEFMQILFAVFAAVFAGRDTAISNAREELAMREVGYEGKGWGEGMGGDMVKQMEHLDSMPRLPIIDRRSSSKSALGAFSSTLGSVTASSSTLSFNRSIWSVAIKSAHVAT